MRHIQAEDGYTLAATWFAPEAPARAVVLIAGAMGVTQGYYAPLASWLAGQGYLAITFDYRGIGGSAPPSLRGFHATLTDWVRLDCAAMIDAAASEADGRPLIWLGHSLGGQILPMVPNADCVERMIVVASGNGYWRYHDRRRLLPIALFWFAVAPLSLAFAGYYPGRRLRLVGDLPAGVMRQWRRWCLHPRYGPGVEGADERYAAFDKAITAFSFTDDEFMSARNTAELYAAYSRAPLAATRIAPRDAGVGRIGHFGCFRPELEPTFWRRYLLGALEQSPAVS